MKTVCISLALGLFATWLQAETPDVDSSRFDVAELASELIRPMELAVAKDGRVFYIELDGLLKCVHPKTLGTTEVGKIEVFNEQENGLIGLALDPEFETNQSIYLHYSPPTYPGQHICRFKLKDGKLDMASEQVLLKFEEQRLECCHHSGSLQFGPNGNLFIGTGDNTHPGGDSQGYAPIDERDGKAPWDAQKSAANTHQLSGKILRIRPKADGSYDIPEGNLFPADGSQGRPEIYVMGCRNPWRMNVDQRTGYVYWGEVGPDAHNSGKRGPRGYDEVNQARSAGNFGWPYFIANNQAYADVDFTTKGIGDRYVQERPVNRSPNNTGAEVLPAAQPAFIYYPYAASEKFPELGQGGRTACAGPVYNFDPSLDSKTKFPQAFDKTLFIFEWTRHWVKAVHLDPQSNIRSIEPFLPSYRFRRPIDMEFGSDGAMYLLEYGETWGVNKDAKLVRIDYVAGNRKPQAVAAVENNVGREPLKVNFSAARSMDKDQDALSYEWTRINTDAEGKVIGKTLLSTDAEPTLTFEEPAAFNVELRVKDGQGGEDLATVPVLVGNGKPAVEFRSASESKVLSSGFFEPGEELGYEIVVNDFEDGTNDLELADEQDLPEIDGESWQRVSTNVRKVVGRFAARDAQKDPPGLQLMKKSDCFNCHDVTQKRVGPPLMDIAERYRPDPHAITQSVGRVMKGSTGVWGKVPMIAHAQHTEEEVHKMVSWIFGLEPDKGIQVIRGFVGRIPTEVAFSGGYELDASYKDQGAKDIGALTTTASVRLRSRFVEAEHADEVQGPAVLENKTADGEKFLGSINHNQFIRLDKIDLGAISKITCRVSSGNKGGVIEVRVGQRDGPLAAKFVVKPTDGWDEYVKATEDFELATEGTDVYSLFFVFLNESNQQAMMNLDSIYFHK